MGMDIDSVDQNLLWYPQVRYDIWYLGNGTKMGCTVSQVPGMYLFIPIWLYASSQRTMCIYIYKYIILK